MLHQRPTALESTMLSWEHIYFNMLCVLDKLRAVYTLSQDPLKRGAQLRAIRQISLRLDLVYSHCKAE